MFNDYGYFRTITQNIEKVMNDEIAGNVQPYFQHYLLEAIENSLITALLTAVIGTLIAYGAALVTARSKMSDKCKKIRPTNNYEKNLFRTILGLEVNQIYDAVGCSECSFGFSGRIALHEVLLINQEIRDAISNAVSKEQLRSLVYNKDVITMVQDGFYKILAGFTTITEVLKLIDLDDEIEQNKR